MKKFILPILMIIVLSSCKKEEPYEIDSFAFGSAYGFCMGNCAHFFLIKNNNLYPDNMDFMTNPLKFKDSTLSADKYNLAKPLQTGFPQYLKDHPNTTIGCPDCHDQGGIRIEIVQEYKTKFWYIDMDSTTQPAEIRDYIAKMKTIIGQL